MSVSPEALSTALLKLVSTTDVDYIPRSRVSIDDTNDDGVSAYSLFVPNNGPHAAGFDYEYSPDSASPGEYEEDEEAEIAAASAASAAGVLALLKFKKTRRWDRLEAWKLRRWVKKYGRLRGLKPATINEISGILIQHYHTLPTLFLTAVTPGGFDVDPAFRGREKELIARLGGMSKVRTESRNADHVLEWMEIEVRKELAREEKATRWKRLGWGERARDVLQRWGVVKKEWDRRDLKWRG